MKREWTHSEKLIHNGKHGHCQRTIPAAGYYRCFALYFKIAIESVFAENRRDTGNALLRKHIIGDDYRIILCPLMTQCIGIQEKSKEKDDDTLQSCILKKSRNYRHTLT